MSDNFKQHKKEINGTVYTAQFNNLRETIRSKKIYTDPVTGRMDTEKLYDYLFQNVIVDPPGLKIEDFDDLDELSEVALFGLQVLNNRFRESGTNERTAERTSKK